MYQHPEPAEIVPNTLFPASASLHVDAVAEATAGGLAQLVEQIQDRERGGVLQDPKAIAVPLPVGNKPQDNDFTIHAGPQGNDGNHIYVSGLSLTVEK